jgi:imidazolonepropionase-like amidohydrolase
MLSIMLMLLLGGITTAALPTAAAIRNARVVTLSGPVIESGTVLLRDGLIEAVGAEVTVPPDAWVIEGQGLTVYPGLIDALSSWGLPKSPEDKKNGNGDSSSSAPIGGPEFRPMTTSWTRAADLARPTEATLEQARDAGFTTAVAFPQEGIFGGEGAVLNLAGESAGEMVVCPLAGQYIALRTSNSSAFPASLMGTIAYIRQVYLDAGQYAQAKNIYSANPNGLPRPKYDRALEGVLNSPRILLPADRTLEVERALRLMDDLNRETILYGLHEGYDAAALLKERGVPVLVNLKWPKREKEADPELEDPLRVLQLREKAPTTPKALSDAGVKWAFYSGGIEKPADVIKAVRVALDAGLSQEDAVRALTLSAAEIFGVSDRLGSIEPGKIANLVVTEGALFQEKTKVRHVFVDGVKFTPIAEPEKKEEQK